MATTTANSSVPRALAIAAISLLPSLAFAPLDRARAEAPVPLLAAGQPVDWWFVFKLNGVVFPQCGAPTVVRACPFGGTPSTHTSKGGPYKFGQQFIFASNGNGMLTQGEGCVGDTTTDPVGATFGEIYNGTWNFLVWNDQFYQHPKVEACGNEDGCGAPWGHSKGFLAWDDNGEGVVVQVSTPSWPGSATKNFTRPDDGNSLGCVKDDDVEVSQHFFALKLDKEGVKNVLRALQNASVVTDLTKQELVRVEGPADVKALFDSLKLGEKSKSTAVFRAPLAPDVELISKPSHLHVPPWQMVSSLLGGVGLRTANWYGVPEIPTTDASTPIECWDDSLTTKPGAVEVATSGEWDGKRIGLKGIDGNGNHAKLGVPIDGTQFVVFGDMNQQGTLAKKDGKCDHAQNARGGLFFVVRNQDLSASVHNLINGDTAPK